MEKTNPVPYTFLMTIFSVLLRWFLNRETNTSRLRPRRKSYSPQSFVNISSGVRMRLAFLNRK